MGSNMDKTVDEVFKYLGFKQDIPYDELTQEEKDTYRQVSDLISQSELSPEKWKEFTLGMVMSLANEVSNHQVTPGDNSSYIKDANLKARLRNYLLNYDFLSAPEKAKKAIERMKQSPRRI